MWEAIAAAAASLIGSWLSNKGSAQAQESANATNVNLNKENRDWMGQMSSTAYQRGVVDMQLAGLNPMLAYSQGGASTPTSAAPVVNPVPKMVSGVGEGIAKGTASALQASQIASTFQSIEQSKAQQALLQAQFDKTRSETMDRDVNTAYRLAEVEERQGKAGIASVEKWLREGTKAWSAKRAMAEGDIAENEARLSERSLESRVSRIREESRRAGYEADHSKYDLSRAGAESRMYERYGGDAIPYISPLMDLVGGASSARRAFGGSRHRSTFEVIK